MGEQAGKVHSKLGGGNLGEGGKLRSLKKGGGSRHKGLTRLPSSQEVKRGRGEKKMLSQEPESPDVMVTLTRRVVCEERGGECREHQSG